MIHIITFNIIIITNDKVNVKFFEYIINLKLFSNPLKFIYKYLITYGNQITTFICRLILLQTSSIFFRKNYGYLQQLEAFFFDLFSNFWKNF